MKQRGYVFVKKILFCAIFFAIYMANSELLKTPFFRFGIEVLNIYGMTLTASDTKPHRTENSV